MFGQALQDGLPAFTNSTRTLWVSVSRRLACLMSTGTDGVTRLASTPATNDIVFAVRCLRMQDMGNAFVAALDDVHYHKDVWLIDNDKHPAWQYALHNGPGAHLVRDQICLAHDRGLHACRQPLLAMLLQAAPAALSCVLVSAVLQAPSAAAMRGPWTHSWTMLGAT